MFVEGGALGVRDQARGGRDAAGRDAVDRGADHAHLATRGVGDNRQLVAAQPHVDDGSDRLAGADGDGDVAAGADGQPLGVAWSYGDHGQ